MQGYWDKTLAQHLHQVYKLPKVTPVQERMFGLIGGVISHISHTSLSGCGCVGDIIWHGVLMVQVCIEVHAKKGQSEKNPKSASNICRS